MFYQVKADLLFANEGDSVTFYRSCERALSKTALINPGQPTVEWSLVQRILNNHDQDPLQPCELIESASTEPEQ